jgi:SAM-dependent methyltransferase
MSSKLKQSFEGITIFQPEDGIWLPKFSLEDGSQEQKKLWEKIGHNYYNHRQFEEKPPTDYKDVIGNSGGLWKRFPKNRHFETILEIGCGDGGASINLSKNLEIDCNEYYGIDISEAQLRRLKIFKEHYNFYPSAQVTLICISARSLPLADQSVDLVMSDAVFMHLSKDNIRILMSEINRVLKPGGMIAFRNSFHNSESLAHGIRNLARKFIPGRNAIYSKQHCLDEINALFRESGLSEKVGPIKVESDGQYLLIPHHLGRKRVPLARYINKSLNRLGIKHKRLVYSFDAYNW